MLTLGTFFTAKFGQEIYSEETYKHVLDGTQLNSKVDATCQATQ